MSILFNLTCLIENETNQRFTLIKPIIFSVSNDKLIKLLNEYLEDIFEGKVLNYKNMLK